jgi:hypothetical protein
MIRTMTARLLQILGLALITLTSVEAQTISDRLVQQVQMKAPYIIGETRNGAPNPEGVDHLMPFDFDGDNFASNNRAHAEGGTVVDGRPTVYYSIVETGSRSDSGYFFIGFYFYHPKDGGASFSTLGVTNTTYNGHDNDLEGVYFVVQKAPDRPDGRLLLTLSEAHGWLIPWFSPGYIGSVFPDPFTNSPCCSAPWAGYNEFILDPDVNLYRAVVAIRSRTHGTYMAQDWTHPNDYFYDGGYGVNPFAPAGVIDAVVHGDGDAIIYRPASASNPVSARDSAQRGGHAYYRLVHLYSDPAWDLRRSAGYYYGGSMLDLGFGESALSAFTTSSGDAEGANPVWAWNGNGACYVNNSTWFHFGTDNSGAFDDCASWTHIPYGSLLTDPTYASSLYFPWFTDLNHWRVTYNPYIGVFGGLTPPNSCPDCHPWVVNTSITGPDQVTSGQGYSWSANVSGGTPPYTYRWSGALTGTDATISGALTQDDNLYLDLWDATGVHVALTKPITVTASCGAQLWQNNVAYHEGDIVCYGEQRWQSTLEGNIGYVPYDGSPYWTLVQ